MAEDGRILVETMDGVGLVTFAGRGPRNAITAAMWQGLAAAVARLEADAAVAVLVLTGAGHVAFATDPAEPDPAYLAYGQSGDGDPPDGRAACERLRRCGKPVLARLRGECIGAGLAVALCADIRIAAADTAFAMTGVRAAELGAEPWLAEAVGVAEARFLLLTGERIETQEALRIGLVTRVVPDADLSDMVADLARQLADGDPVAMRATKQALVTPAR
jgi:enoyl-CoA hydratase/carnithine racemase